MFCFEGVFSFRILKSFINRGVCEEPMQSSSKLKTLKISTIAITSVVFVEVILGVAVGSLAILSDGAHALLDALTTLVLFLTTRASLKPPDEEHMYGHEKFEPIGGLVGGIALIGIALLTMYEAVLRIMQNVSINLELEFAGFIAIGYTLCIDFLRISIFRKTIESESSTMKAGFYHALADFSSTLLALLGFGLATIGSYPSSDALASVVLSILLIYLSIRLVWSSGMELSDAVSRDVVEKVRKNILCTKGICKCENLKVRKAGAKTFVEATVQVPDYMSFEEAHTLSSKVEETLKKSLGNVSVTIHVEPSETEMRTEKLVEKLATEVEGVKEAHEVNAVCTSGKLYITLHARVDPKLSVQEAHELAGKIEDKISNCIANIENITVHIEPFSPKTQRGSTANEREIRKIVYSTCENFRRMFHVKRIVTYTADGKRYINIDCCFAKGISIEKAHNMASEIEDSISKQFAETIVTVHMEPEQN
jgi:cation diffusion facilitator family transporter